ncbi:beta-lactamase family protein [Phaeosphaeria sp. MPI-PUGE-AT-0046c]|nr:beta-lactamase family protein [Phaeosphaeria sp. MPI-PUGE-AT-0046c]
MAPKISPQATTSLRSYIENATTGPSPTIPGAVVHVIDSNATALFTHGSSALHSPTATSISIIHSLTKIIGSIAFLQLIERKLVTSLDDPSIIPQYLPELAAKKVLTGSSTNATGEKEWHFEERVGDITPRMLMNHTYGGGHTLMNELLFAYLSSREDVDCDKINEAVDPYGTLLVSPLLWQPGTKTNYAQGFDWLAVLIERVTKQSLVQYLQENIFDPLKLQSMGFEPAFAGRSLEREGNEGKFWPRILKSSAQGKVSHAVLDPGAPETVTRPDAFPHGTHHVGCLGTGLIGSAEDYARLVSILLPQNNGVDPVSKVRVLSPDSVREICTPCLSEELRCNSRNIPASSASPIVLPAALEAKNFDPRGSYGLGCGVQGADRVLADGRRGRSKGSVYWYGAANTEFWIDGEKGVVMVANGNYYPWNDPAWADFVAGVEGIVYESLKE